MKWQLNASFIMPSVLLMVLLSVLAVCGDYWTCDQNQIYFPPNHYFHKQATW